jgi:TfoX/Sxy family transcriptional regulator of competence genes
MRDPIYTEDLRARSEEAVISKLQQHSDLHWLDPEEARRVVREALEMAHMKEEL